jgi:3-methylcrotonyl-CoA carboxylase alpha subunit
MFDKILIANRGEIACRVDRHRAPARHRTPSRCTPMPTRDAKHARHGDEAVHIGPPGARELPRGDAHHRARSARAPGHPSRLRLPVRERRLRAGLCAAGLVFIGPPPRPSARWASKSAAKTLMEQAPVCRWCPATMARIRRRGAAREAERIGYPVLIKARPAAAARACGSSRAEADFPTRWAACAARGAPRSATTACWWRSISIARGTSRCRFLRRHGNCVHLFERDCSVQRRHQKVMEEAPAPGLTPCERRRAMGDAAVAAAGRRLRRRRHRRVHRRGRWRVLLHGDEHPLQVEHPVTEMITGLDLVEWQLRVAAGEPLPLVQEQLGIHGHALEARIYAEDPATRSARITTRCSRNS